MVLTIFYKVCSNHKQQGGKIPCWECIVLFQPQQTQQERTDLMQGGRVELEGTATESPRKLSFNHSFISKETVKKSQSCVLTHDLYETLNFFFSPHKYSRWTVNIP